MRFHRQKNQQIRLLNVHPKPFFLLQPFTKSQPVSHPKEKVGLCLKALEPICSSAHEETLNRMLFSLHFLIYLLPPQNKQMYQMAPKQ